MDAIALLKHDHDEVKAIFKKLEPTTERAIKTREELFTKLKQELDIHSQIEEQILYPILKKESETRDITLEGYEEHHVLDLLLQELAVMPVGSEQWAAKLKVLQENFEHHVEEEETDMFKSAREILSKEQLKEIGAHMAEEKSRLTATAKSAQV